MIQVDITTDWGTANAAKSKNKIEEGKAITKFADHICLALTYCWALQSCYYFCCGCYFASFCQNSRMHTHTHTHTYTQPNVNIRGGSKNNTHNLLQFIKLHNNNNTPTKSASQAIFASATITAQRRSV